MSNWLIEVAEAIRRGTWLTGAYPRCDDPGAHQPGCLCDGGEPL